MRVVEAINHTLTYDEGHRLYELIKQDLQAGNPVEVDFAGTGGLPSSFLHGFLAQSFELIGYERARLLIKIKGVTKVQADDIRQYVATFRSLETKVA